MSDDIAWLNKLAADRAEAELLTCCASRYWARKMVARRPYADRAGLIAAAVSAVEELAWPDVEEALSAHPRIGARTAAAPTAREESWSRQEQSGTATADSTVLDQLTAGNHAYEQRFGHVFLIRATGRSAEEMLSELRKRLDNSVGEERIATRGELADITWLRVEKLLADRQEARQ